MYDKKCTFLSYQPLSHIIIIITEIIHRTVISCMAGGHDDMTRDLLITNSTFSCRSVFVGRVTLPEKPTALTSNHIFLCFYFPWV